MSRSFASPDGGAELSSKSTSDWGLEEKLKARIVVSVPELKLTVLSQEYVGGS